MLLRFFSLLLCNTHGIGFVLFCVWIYILTADASPTELNTQSKNQTEQNRTQQDLHVAIWESATKRNAKLMELAFEDGKRNANTNTNENERVNNNNSKMLIFHAF